MTTVREKSGLLLVDKPKDLTSHDVVGRLRRILNQKSVGHTGTLDPMATGLMVIVLGEATKLSDFLTFSEKSYWLKAKLGVRTDTLDATGKVLSQSEVSLARETIEKEALALQGEFDWPVPLFSAAKIGGKKLYEFGRREEEVDLPIKRMNFHSVDVHDVGEDWLTATVSCSKGSFIRTWCAQLGDRLGVGGHLQELSRLSVGPYNLDQAVTLDQLTEDTDAAMGRAFISMSKTLPEWRAIRVAAKEERLLQNGQIPRDLANRLIVEQKEALRRGEAIGVKVLTTAGDLLSILMALPGNGLKIRRVFRLDPAPLTQ